MTRAALIIPVLAALAVVAALACSDDSPSGQTPSASPLIPTPTQSPTPLEQIGCEADLPDVTLESGGSSQAAVPLASEWTGPDCAIGGQSYPYYYIPGEPLPVAARDALTLVISQQPEKLAAWTWQPDLTNSTQIASGELALPMDLANTTHRTNARELPVQLSASQQLDIAGLSPGEYVIEVLGFWPDGVATLALYATIEP
jgi:hypothetical protein